MEDEHAGGTQDSSAVAKHARAKQTPVSAHTRGLIVMALTLIAVCCLVAVVILTIKGQKIEGSLITVLASCVGALGGIADTARGT